MLKITKLSQSIFLFLILCISIIFSLLKVIHHKTPPRLPPIEDNPPHPPYDPEKPIPDEPPLPPIPPQSSWFYVTFDEIPMVSTNWLNMWLIDTTPFFLRLGLVKLYENSFPPSQKLRDFFLGEPININPDQNGNIWYTDRTIAPVPFEAISFLLTDSLTDGVGYLARSIFTKLITKFRYFKSIENGLLHAQTSINLKLEALSNYIPRLKDRVKEFSLWINQEKTRLQNNIHQIHNLEQMIQHQLTSHPSWTTIKNLRLQIQSLNKEKKQILETIKTLGNLFESNLSKLIKEQINHHHFIADIQAINAKIISNTITLLETQSTKSYLFGVKFYNWWENFQKIIPKIWKMIKNSLLFLKKIITAKITTWFYSYWVQKFLITILDSDIVFWIAQKLTSVGTLIKTFFQSILNKLQPIFSFVTKSLTHTSSFLTAILPIIATPFINNSYSSQHLPEIQY